MKFIYSSRGGGKSQFLVKYLLSNPDAIAIFANHQRLAVVRSQHRDLEKRLFTISQFGTSDHRTFMGLSEKAVAVIDDVEDVLQTIIGIARIEFATTSAPTTQLNPQVIDRIHVTESGQKHAFPPPEPMPGISSDLDVIASALGKATVETLKPNTDQPKKS